jgi:hypothetical protein
VLVHGIGQQSKGDTLDYMGRPLIDFIQSYSPPNLDIRVQEIPDTGEAHAKLRLKHDGAEEEWIVTEAWWARSFVPTSLMDVWWWAFKGGPIWARTFWKTLILGFRRDFRGDDTIADEPWQTPVYERKARGRLARFVDVLIGFPWWLVGFVAYTLGWLIVLLLLVLALLPIDLIRKPLLTLLIGYLGDQVANTHNVLARESTSSAVLNVLEPWFEDEAFESITVLADSGGAPVAFHALTSRTMHRWVKTFAGKHQKAPAITLYTTGSGLNAAYKLGKDGEYWKQRQFPPGAVRWIDLWSQYDIVAAGPVDTAIAELSQPAEHVDLRVSGRDNPIQDHGSYYENQEEVLARILHGILRNRDTGAAPRKFNRYAIWNETNMQTHRHRVGQFAALRLLSFLGGVGTAWLFVAMDWLNVWLQMAKAMIEASGWFLISGLVGALSPELFKLLVCGAIGTVLCMAMWTVIDRFWYLRLQRRLKTRLEETVSPGPALAPAAA